MKYSPVSGKASEKWKYTHRERESRNQFTPARNKCFIRIAWDSDVAQGKKHKRHKSSQLVLKLVLNNLLSERVSASIHSMSQAYAILIRTTATTTALHINCSNSWDWSYEHEHCFSLSLTTLCVHTFYYLNASNFWPLIIKWGKINKQTNKRIAFHIVVGACIYIGIT